MMPWDLPNRPHGGERTGILATERKNSPGRRESEARPYYKKRDITRGSKAWTEVARISCLINSTHQKKTYRERGVCFHSH